MKRNFILLALAAVGFAGASCEQHRWENKVKTIEEPVYDEDKKPVMVENTEGKLVQKVEVTHVIEEAGAKAFFYDEYGEKKLKSKGKKHSDAEQ